MAHSRNRLDVGVKSERGHYRERNEDSVLANAELGLFIVADGIGGAPAGEAASAMAVEIIQAVIAESVKRDTASAGRKPRRGRSRVSRRRRATITPEPADLDEPAVQEIQQALLEANREILSLSLGHDEFRGMGSTVVLALVRPETTYVTGIGDSRAHWIRGGRIRQLTTDHTLAQALVESGKIDGLGRHPPHVAASHAHLERNDVDDQRGAIEQATDGGQDHRFEMPTQFVAVDRFHAIILDKLGIEINGSQMIHTVHG